MDVGTSHGALAGLPTLTTPGASAGSSWWYRTLINSEAPSPQSSAEPAGNGATHFMTNLLTRVSHHVRTIYQQPSPR